MNTLKTIFWFTVILVAMVALFKWSEMQESKVMSINYCWDSNGEHYVAPNEACRN